MRYFERKWPGLLLWPLSLLYAGIMRWRNRYYASTPKARFFCKVPVISVGNITVGGTGKTPTVQMLTRYYLEHHLKVCIISRGYGRRTRERRLVSDGTAITSDTRTCGDEPVMLAHSCPGAIVIADADRAAAMQWALKQFHPDLFILDDAFQHRRVYRDLDIVTFRAADPMGNGFVLPAGPLREPVSGLNRASVLWFNGDDLTEEAGELNPHVPQVHARYRIQDMLNAQGKSLPPDLSGKRVVAFCGLAHPENLKKTLKSLKPEHLTLIPFKDHHIYTAEDMVQLVQTGQEQNADLLVTTEKDWYKLPRSECDSRLWCLRIRLDVQHPKALEPVLDSLVQL
ncbi:MAG: tetraacyldisaccharide 4'-kinase [candidate division KSB1 bacterium]|nr:tetraacyldisaccharide 4'-kinase [candidate division KSB1 bacterium]